MSFRVGSREWFDGKPRSVFWKTQFPVDYIDTSLVINTWETVSANLSGGKPAKLWFIIVEQTNNGGTVETLEFELTINGTAYLVTLTDAASGVQRYICLRISLLAGGFELVDSALTYTIGNPAGASVHQAMPFQVESVGLVRIRQTSTVDAVSAQIEVNIVWEKLVAQGI